MPSTTGCRHDAPDHANGLAPRVTEDVLAKRHRFPFDLAGDTAEITKDVGRAPDLGTGLRPDGVPRFESEDPGERLDLGLHGVGDLQQHPSAVAGCHEPPRPERGGSCADRRVNIGAGRARHLADRGAVRRVFDIDEPPSELLEGFPSISIRWRSRLLVAGVRGRELS